MCLAHLYICVFLVFITECSSDNDQYCDSFAVASKNNLYFHIAFGA